MHRFDRGQVAIATGADEHAGAPLRRSTTVTVDLYRYEPESFIESGSDL